MSNNKQFAVLGLGRFGQSVVKSLTDAGCDVLACDKNYEMVQEMADIATHAIQADFTDEHALESLGLGNFDVVVIAIGNDLESNIMAALYAKEKGAGYIISKAADLMQKKILEKIGVDRVVLPEMEMGARLATSLLTTNVIDYINLSDELSIAEIHPLQQWVDESIKNAGIRAKTGLNVVALKRGKKIIVKNIVEEILKTDDLLVVLGDIQDIQKLKDKK